MRKKGNDLTDFKLPSKRGKGILPWFYGNREGVIPIYRSGLGSILFFEKKQKTVEAETNPLMSTTTLLLLLYIWAS